MAILASGVDTRTLSPDQQAALGRINGGKPIPLQSGQTMQGMAEANRLFPGDPGYTQTKTPFYTSEQSTAEIGRNAGMGQPTSQEYFNSITPQDQQSFLSGFRSSYNGGNVNSGEFINSQDPNKAGDLNGQVYDWTKGWNLDSNFMGGLDKNNPNLVLFGNNNAGTSLFGEAPEAPNFQQDYKDTLQTLGYEQSNRDLGAVESQINSIRSTLSQLQDTYQNYIQDMEGKGGFENIVAGRQARLNTDYQRRAQPLIRALDSLVQQQTNLQNRQKQIREDVLTQIQLGQKNYEYAMQAFEGRKGDAKWAIEQQQKMLERQADDARNGRLDELNLIKTLTDIPEGMTIRLSDGSEYTGLKSDTTNIKQISETDAQGKVTVVGINADGSIAYKTDLGVIGKPQLNTDELIKRLTVDEAIKLGLPFGTPETQAYGVTPVSPAARTDISSIDTLTSSIDKVLGKFDTTTGKLPGVGGLGVGTAKEWLSRAFGYGTDTEREVRQTVNNIKAEIAKLRGGTSFTPNEQTLLESYTPTINESSVNLMSKLNNLRAFLQSKKSSLYGGVTNDDPMGLFSNSVSGNAGQNPKVGMRTDRHNNPTAFTTDVAKMAGLREGIDYSKGDPFQGGVTARLLGDPISTTIKVIDKIGFQTASGKPRWTHTNIPKSTWDRYTYAQKKEIIQQMYKREGGTALTSIFG